MTGTSGGAAFARPTFLVIGAMRSGTTTLYYSLREHPDVSMASVKEANFFSIVDGMTDLPLSDLATTRLISNSVATPDEYSKLFRASNSTRAVGEVSPSYLYSPGAAARIRSALGVVQLVALLRDPVDRAYSAYLRRADVNDDPEAFLEVAESEQRSLALGRRLPAYPLVLGGLYAHHLEPYLASFLPSQLWIRIYEEFWADPEHSFRDLHQFIGVEAQAPMLDAQLNRSGVPRYPRLDKALRSGARLKGYAKRHLPPRLLRSLVDLKQRAEDWSLQTPARIPPEIRTRLIERYFESDIRRLEEILGRHLPAWLA